MKTELELREIIQNEYNKKTTDTNHNFISRFAKAVYDSQKKVTYPKDGTNEFIDPKTDCTCSNEGICDVCMEDSQGLTDLE